MRSPFVLGFFFALAGCASSQQTVIEDAKPPANVWAEASLDVMGPDADNDKRKTCTKEARAMGIFLHAAAPVRTQLYLGEDGNKVSISTEPGEQFLGKWTTEGLCRVALGRATLIDSKVKVVKNEVSPVCKPMGSVEGMDQGFAFFAIVMGSYEAAVVQAQVQAVRRQANVVVVDAVRQLGLNIIVNGRAFQCPPGAEAPAGAPPQPTGTSL